MARFATTKIQLSGYRMLVRQMEQAFSLRSISRLTSPLSQQTLTFGIGALVAMLIPAAGLFMSFFSPRADQNGAPLIITKSGGLYVMYDQELHPVTNLASARLILGKAAVPKVVKDNALAGQARGHLMGVPSGPNNLTQRLDDTAKWAVCDRHTDESDLSLTTTNNLTTTLFAGTDSMSTAVSPQRSNDAVVVKLASDPKQVWLITNGSRFAVGAQDMAARSALGMSPDRVDNAIPISEGLFNTIPAAPALTTPYIANRGQVNPVLPEVLNGDVIITSAVDGARQYFAALENGVQPISEFIAQLLVNTGSNQITSMDRETVAAAPLASDIDVTRYPQRAPNFKDPHVVCWSWERRAKDLRATTTVLTGESLPIASERSNQVVELLKSKGSVVTASASVMTPGRGWLVQVTGMAPTSHAAEQLMWIDDTGVRYFIGPDRDTANSPLAAQSPLGPYERPVHALGIGAHEPLPIPWQIAKLFAPGSTLSKEAAMTYHTLLPDDLNQKAVSDNPVSLSGADYVPMR